MPKGHVFASKAQSAAMHAAAEGRSTLGIPESVGKKLVKEGHGQKIGGLPQHVKKAKGGLVRAAEAGAKMGGAAGALSASRRRDGDELRELAQERMNTISARGDAAVQPGPANAKERTEDIDNYYRTWGEMPSPGKGVLAPPERRAPTMKREVTPIAKPRGYARGGSVTSSNKPSCKW